MIYRNKIVPEQHSFYKNQSTPTNLLVYQLFYSPLLNVNFKVDAVWIDLLKAFDNICHPRLIHKLKLMGICAKRLKKITSYLSGREHRYASLGL